MVPKSKSDVNRKLRSWQALPDSLKDYPRWVVWQNQSGLKVPVDKSLRNTDPHKSKLDFDQVYGIAEKLLGQGEEVGIGIVIYEGCGLVAIDLDSVSKWQKEADKIIEAFEPHSYIETSPSGNGYHILMDVDGKSKHRVKRKDFYGGKVEVYTKLRFLTITGADYTGDLDDSHSAEAQKVLADFMEPLIGDSDDDSDTPKPKNTGTEQKFDDDQVVMEMAGIMDRKA
jgi:primase-polymerase (primpol)-like protein